MDPFANWMSSTSISFIAHTNSVKEYWRRLLTYEADILNAFAGLIRVSRSWMRSPFIFGQQETELVLAPVNLRNGEMSS